MATSRAHPLQSSISVVYPYERTAVGRAPHASRKHVESQASLEILRVTWLLAGNPKTGKMVPWWRLRHVTGRSVQLPAQKTNLSPQRRAMSLSEPPKPPTHSQCRSDAFRRHEDRGSGICTKILGRLRSLGPPRCHLHMSEQGAPQRKEIR